MTITLTPSQIDWLQAQVDAGQFANLDEAAQAAINELMLRQIEEDDDLDWAKPMLDEARAEIARGEFLTLEEFNTFIDQQVAELKR